ncbi:hypothetical protein [Nocardia sp. CA-135398]|uniref:hypothetical protein n=1 Tax=Nocardia sp. CA-135398 TaxID=3239977 RepID=UPI003D9512A6
MQAVDESLYRAQLDHEFFAVCRIAAAGESQFTGQRFGSIRQYFQEDLCLGQVGIFVHL